MQKSMYIIPDTTLILDRRPREYPLIFRDLPANEKPREKLLAYGPEALSIAELTALLLVTGTTREDVLEMSTRLVREYGEKSVFAGRRYQNFIVKILILF